MPHKRNFISIWGPSRFSRRADVIGWEKVLLSSCADVENINVQTFRAYADDVGDFAAIRGPSRRTTNRHLLFAFPITCGNVDVPHPPTVRV